MALKTIILGERGVRKEANAGEAITPGMLVELTSAAQDTVQKHATAGGRVMPAFAVEDDLQGKTIDDDYAINTRVQYNTFRSGDRVLAWLANGENATKGAKLVSNGDGKLAVAATDSGDSTQHPVCQAAEAVDMSDSSGADPTGRIIVEIL
jgi:hypothetical protein